MENELSSGFDFGLTFFALPHGKLKIYAQMHKQCVHSKNMRTAFSPHKVVFVKNVWREHSHLAHFQSSFTLKLMEFNIKQMRHFH